MTKELDTSSVQDWIPGLKRCRTTGCTAATNSARAHAMLPSEEDSTVNYKLNCPAWRKSYADVLLGDWLWEIVDNIGSHGNGSLPAPLGISC